MKKNFVPILLVAALALFAACDKKPFYQSTKKLPNGIWAFADTLNYDFTIQDTARVYRMSLWFDYADSFPNQNIYLKLYTRFPDGRRFAKVLNFDLYDQKGNPNGTGAGKHRVAMNLQEKTLFNQTGNYQLTLEQFTRRDSIPGISNIGLVIETLEAVK